MPLANKLFLQALTRLVQISPEPPPTNALLKVTLQTFKQFIRAVQWVPLTPSEMLISLLTEAWTNHHVVVSWRVWYFCFAKNQVETLRRYRDLQPRCQLEILLQVHHGAQRVCRYEMQDFGRCSEQDQGPDSLFCRRDLHGRKVRNCRKSDTSLLCTNFQFFQARKWYLLCHRLNLDENSYRPGVPAFFLQQVP